MISEVIIIALATFALLLFSVLQVAKWADGPD
jgi:hypothetical protein